MENIWLFAGVPAASSAGDGALRDLVALARAIQPLLLTAGGLWALYLYRSSRRGEVRVGIQASCRIIREWIPARSVLLVKLRIANTSSVIYRHREATATLFDARRQSGDGTVRLVPFAGADPVPPVYGDVVFDPGELAAGRAFVLHGQDEIYLEPGEHFDSEVAFVLDSDRLGLMALRVLVRGRHRRWNWWRLREEP